MLIRSDDDTKWELMLHVASTPASTVTLDLGAAIHLTLNPKTPNP